VKCTKGAPAPAQQRRRGSFRAHQHRFVTSGRPETTRKPARSSASPSESRSELGIALPPLACGIAITQAARRSPDIFDQHQSLFDRRHVRSGIGDAPVRRSAFDNRSFGLSTSPYCAWSGPPLARRHHSRPGDDEAAPSRSCNEESETSSSKTQRLLQLQRPHGRLPRHVATRREPANKPRGMSEPSHKDV